MPWTLKQHRLFQAAAHDAAFAKKVGITQEKAKKMANEGVMPKSMSQAIKHLSKHHK